MAQIQSQVRLFDLEDAPAQSPRPSAASTHLVAAADAVLAQCESLVLAVSDAAYSADSQSLRGGTLGKHLRHTLDHFAAALAPAADPAHVIAYDQRRRDVPMETSRGAAIAALARLRRDLARGATHGLHRGVRVRVMVDASGKEIELSSTFGRELAFATHHAIHHQAMMKAIASELGVALDDRFGKAPSTLSAAR